MLLHTGGKNNDKRVAADSHTHTHTHPLFLQLSDTVRGRDNTSRPWSRRQPFKPLRLPDPLSLCVSHDERQEEDQWKI